jgi:hypothetical protein
MSSWISLARHARWATPYRTGRVLLAGDAAHAEARDAAGTGRVDIVTARMDGVHVDDAVLTLV